MKISITDKQGNVLYEGSPKLTDDGITIGTSPDAGIRITKMGIASEQIRLRFNSEGDLTLHDIQSPFGTKVDGKTIKPGFITVIPEECIIEMSEDVFVTLSKETSVTSEKNYSETFFPYFLARNETYVREAFDDIRTKIPREYYYALSSLEGELVGKIRELSAVLDISYAINAIASFSRLLDFTLEMSLAVTGAERALVLLFNEDLNRLEPAADMNFSQKDINREMRAIWPIIKKTFETGTAAIGPARNFPSDSPSATLAETGIESIAVLPLQEFSAIIGVLYIDSKQLSPLLTVKSEQLLKVFASQATTAITRAKLLHEATADPVTGAANQTFLMRRLAEEYHRAIRHETPLCVLLGEIGGFSSMERIYGQAGVKRLLKNIAAIIAGEMRIHDLAARTRNDLMAIILPETPLEGAKTVAEKLRKTIANTRFRVGDSSVGLTMSFGTAILLKSAKKPSDLLTMASKSLERAKELGGNRVI